MILFSSLFILVFIYFFWNAYQNKQWNSKPIDNFPFKYKGKTYWYSRSVATTLACFCKNTKGEICVLANKRGIGTPDYQGYWNLISGYLQFHLTGQENCVKELKEETGVDIDADSILFHSVNTSPLLNKQNVSLLYYTILNGVIDDYVTSSSFSEKNEVEEIEWIPITNINKYKWAFNHNDTISKIYRDIAFQFN